MRKNKKCVTKNRKESRTMKKVLSVILAIVAALGMISVTACAKHEHSYSHACDVTCNECGKKREIKPEETVKWRETDSSTFKTKNTLSGEVGAQYVLKLPYDFYEIRLYIPNAEGEFNDSNSRWLVANYDVRIFDENFNELRVEFGEDADDYLGYAYIIDEDGDYNEPHETWHNKITYFMFTIKVAGDNFIIALQ